MRMMFAAALAGCLSTPAMAQVPEVANPQLPDIAMVTVDPYGNPIIVYNPLLCQQAGVYLCEFYRMHEYGHIVLGHTIVPLFPNVKEAQADCWAAQNASPVAVQAALQWFMSGGGSTLQHGSGPERAQRVMQCTGQ